MLGVMDVVRLGALWGESMHTAGEKGGEQLMSPD